MQIFLCLAVQAVELRTTFQSYSKCHVLLAQLLHGFSVAMFLFESSSRASSGDYDIKDTYIASATCSVSGRAFRQVSDIAILSFNNNIYFSYIQMNRLMKRRSYLDATTATNFLLLKSSGH